VGRQAAASISIGGITTLYDTSGGLVVLARAGAPRQAIDAALAREREEKGE
jgi:hypothetical protein